MASDVVVEPYSAILTIHNFLKEVDGVHVLDNEGVYDLVRYQFKIKEPRYSDLNSIMSQAITGATTPLRFKSDKLGNMTQYLDHLVPYQPLQFLMTGLPSITGINSNANDAFIKQVTNHKIYLYLD